MRLGIHHVRSLRGPALGLVLGLTCVQASADVATEQRLAVLERQVGQLGEMSMEIDAVRSENRQLRGEIQDLQHQLIQLQSKQRDMYLDIDQRLSALQGKSPAAQSAGSGTLLPVTPEPSGVPVVPGDMSQAGGPAIPAGTPPNRIGTAGGTPSVGSGGMPAPSTATMPPPATTPPAATAAPVAPVKPGQMEAAYTAAYDLLTPQQRQYKAAAQAFTAFLQQYPNSPLAGNAQYWLAEAYYVSHNNAAALQAFQTVVQKYPNSTKVPGSLYKIARLQSAAGDRAAAVQTLQQLISRFPESPAADLGSELLSRLQQ